MKKLLIALGLMLAANQAFALWPSHVYEGATSSVTFITVNVSTSAATRMDSTVLGSRTILNVQNQSAGVLYCGTSTSTTTLNTSGYIVGSSETWNFGLGDSIGLWCYTSGSSAAKSIVIQGY
jgi:hypothetical protein